MTDSLAADVSLVAKIDAVPRILEVICRTTGLGFSAVARVTETHWVACAVRDEIAFGLVPGGELVLGTTICDEIRQSGELVVIDDVDTDPVYECHHTPKRYGFKSYISVPIRLADGHFFGTLCGIDPRPAPLNKPETVEMFKLFADLIAHHLDAQRQVAASAKALLNEQEASKLREQFIAVLGHDLRNPLSSVSSGAELLLQLPKGDRAIKVRDRIQRSVTRMTELIDNVLDLARGRLGGGFSLDVRTDHDVEGVLNQVTSELESAWPERTVRREVLIPHPFACDSARVGQLLSNLLANALTHGDPASPVVVRAATSPAAFALSVTNNGVTIPPRVLAQLFEPYFRNTTSDGPQGLGLGLYIASEIARAHGGALTATSIDGVTCFTFEMPIAAA